MGEIRVLFRINHKRINFFVIGATARDLVLYHGYGIQAIRATHDIDLAVQVTSWQQFETLKTGLIETESFRATRMLQRLIYKDGIPVDIVPFGLEPGSSSISWPPDHAVHLNILGVEDALKHVHKVRLRTDPVLDIAVTSPVSLAALKLITWKDRAPANTRDAPDLLLIIRNYLDMDNHERLQREHSDLVTEDFDYVRTGARLLGRDMARALGKKAIAAIQTIIEEQTTAGNRYPLVEDMSRGASADQFEENLMLLKAVRDGLNDAT